MAPKENQRVMLTKRLLKDALVELLREKDIYKVSVRELCERAQINRTTFYNHYDSQFNLLAELEGDVLGWIAETLDSAPYGKRSLSAVCGYIEENLDLMRLLINNNVDPLFPEKLFSLPQVQDGIAEVFGKSMEREGFEYLSSFLTYGAYRVICLWINKENREPSEFVAELILSQVANMAA